MLFIKEQSQLFLNILPNNQKYRAMAPLPDRLLVSKHKLVNPNLTKIQNPNIISNPKQH